MLPYTEVFTDDKINWLLFQPGKSDVFDSCNQPSDLLIGAGDIIWKFWNQGQITDIFCPCELEIGQMTLKTI